MPVLGVLGHTDHGKSTFLEKLTGVNPMHLPEERQRGLTIQLGFAYWTPDTPGAKQITILDVPGHERYLRNMLRGILGMDAAVLLVAADDGLMPGTYEHIRASLFAGFEHGIVLITKTDLVPPQRVEEVRAELVEFLHGTFWERMPLLTFSAVNPENLPEIKAKLYEMAQAAERHDEQPFAHFFVDRVFTAEGEGVVVTGTLRGKPLKVGDTLHLLPEGREVRLRKIIQDNYEVDQAQTHSRVALNIVGVKRDQINVGDLLGSTSVRPSSGMLAAVLGLPPAHMRERELDWRKLEKKCRDLHLNIGSTALTVESLEAVPLGEDGNALVLITVAEKLPVLPGLCCIFYETGATTITCGGRICSTPGFKGLRKARRYEALAIACKNILAVAPSQAALASDEAVSLAGVALELELAGLMYHASQPTLSLIPEEVELQARKRLAKQLTGGEYITSDTATVSRARLASEVNYAKRRLTELLDANPMAGQVELAKLLPKDAALAVVPHEEIAVLFNSVGLEFASGKVGLPGTGDGIPPQWREAYERIMKRFRGDPSGFPTLIMLKQDFPAASKLLSELMAKGMLIQLGAEGALVTGEVFDRWVAQIRQQLARKGQITLGEAKEITRTTRKYIVPLLERMDRMGITRRDGDVRKPGPKF